MQQMRRSLDTNKAGINSIYLPSSFIVVTNEEIWYTFRIFARVHKFRGEFVAVAKVFRTPAPLPARLSSLLSSSLKPRVTTTVIPVALAAALCYLVGHPRRRDGVQVWALSIIWKEAEKKGLKSWSFTEEEPSWVIKRKLVAVWITYVRYQPQKRYGLSWVSCRAFLKSHETISGTIIL